MILILTPLLIKEKGKGDEVKRMKRKTVDGVIFHEKKYETEKGPPKESF